MPTRSLRHIGIVNQTSAGWAAAASYTRMLVHSLSKACQSSNIKVSVFATSADDTSTFDDPDVEVIRPRTKIELPGEGALRKTFGLAPRETRLRGEARFRNALRIGDETDVFATASKHKVDVLLPLFDLPPWDVNIRTIGWIPDFQHFGLPHLFSSDERARRDASMRRIVDKANLVMLSSNNSQQDYIKYISRAEEKVRVVPFPSLLAFLPLSESPDRTREKFNLPRKFAMVANQFWSHKNHMLVIEAISKLKRRGTSIPVVMTGMLTDHRDPSGKLLSSLLQAIAGNDLSGQISILGMVPYSDLIDLMRSSALIIQPSRFEGWSTVVQDTKAIGRPLLCSDIPVHREQATDAIGFFDCDNAEELASMLETHWAALNHGPDLERERISMAVEQSFAKEHGRKLLEVCVEACRC